MGATALLLGLWLSDSAWVRVVLFEGKKLNRLVVEYKGERWAAEVQGENLLVNGRPKDELVVWGSEGKSLTLPDGTKRTYPGKLIVRAKGGRLEVLNVVRVSQYLASVVAAEMGQAPLEALKAQAVLSRTLLFKRLLEKGRVISDHEGFQVYRGLGPVFPEAARAVEATENLVLAYKGRLAQVYFHAACGGVLASASQAWGAKHPPYIRMGVDTVCLSDSSQRWEKRLFWKGPRVRLLAWGRGAKAKVGSALLTGPQLRRKFGLKSAFITKITQKGDTLIIQGRGHGHGVGLCQRGAILRAQRGDSFCEILSFYFPGATLTTVKKVQGSKAGREK